MSKQSGRAGPPIFPSTPGHHPRTDWHVRASLRHPQPRARSAPCHAHLSNIAITPPTRPPPVPPQKPDEARNRAQQAALATAREASVLSNGEISFDRAMDILRDPSFASYAKSMRPQFAIALSPEFNYFVGEPGADKVSNGTGKGCGSRDAVVAPSHCRCHASVLASASPGLVLTAILAPASRDALARCDGVSMTACTHLYAGSGADRGAVGEERLRRRLGPKISCVAGNSGRTEVLIWQPQRGLRTLFVRGC